MVYRKVFFCLGLQKTCLTSLLKLMRQEGYDATGRDHQMMKNFHRGHYREISDFYERHDFFCDYPTPLLYKPIFERYGKAARYILSMRKDAETWYASLLRHNEYAHPVKHKHKNVFGRFYIPMDLPANTRHTTRSTIPIFNHSLSMSMQLTAFL